MRNKRAAIAAAPLSLALLLAAIGLFGLMSYNVARRTNEIGIRMATGARQFDILSQFLSEAIVVTGVGGNPATFAVGRFLNALISFGVVTVAIFFLVVKPMDAMDARLRGSKQDAPPAPTEVELLVEIRDLLRDRPASEG